MGGRGGVANTFVYAVRIRISLEGFLVLNLNKTEQNFGISPRSSYAKNGGGVINEKRGNQ